MDLDHSSLLNEICMPRGIWIESIYCVLYLWSFSDALDENICLWMSVLGVFMYVWCMTTCVYYAWVLSHTKRGQRKTTGVFLHGFSPYFSRVSHWSFSPWFPLAACPAISYDLPVSSYNTRVIITDGCNRVGIKDWTQFLLAFTNTFAHGVLSKLKSLFAIGISWQWCPVSVFLSPVSILFCWLIHLTFQNDVTMWNSSLTVFLQKVL